MLIDHVTKTAEGRGRWAIGAQAKLADVTGAAYVVDVSAEVAPGKVGRLALRVAKDRPGLVRAVSVDWRSKDRTAAAATFVVDATDPDRLSVSIEAPTEQADTADTEMRTDILQTIREQDGLSTRQIRGRTVGTTTASRQPSERWRTRA